MIGLPSSSTGTARFAMPRRGVSIGLIGADGAGKSTVAEAVRAAEGANAVCVYMGLYQQGAFAVRLPGLNLATLACARAWRGVVGQTQQARGKLVIFDRCAADALLDPVQPLGRAGRARRWVLAHTCPRPGLMVLLDAPGTVLAARTGTPDPATSEDQRQRYLALRKRLPELFVLDATRSVTDLCEEIQQLARIGTKP